MRNVSEVSLATKTVCIILVTLTGHIHMEEKSTSIYGSTEVVVRIVQ